MRHPDARPSAWLDPFLPAYEVHEHHETEVSAPAAVAWRAAHEVDLGASPVIRAIFAAREWVMGSHAGPRPPARPFLDALGALGWRVLVDEPGHALVMGAVTQPWLPDVTFRGLDPAAFVAFETPGFTKIAWTLVVQPTGPASSRVVTETRVCATDADARRRFRRYWRFVSPGIRLIRHRLLALIRRHAERAAAGVSVA
ncbi:MAG: hypothetical protein R2712_26145 [Vicinamibacterales bacterium]